MTRQQKFVAALYAANGTVCAVTSILMETPNLILASSVFFLLGAVVAWRGK